jgi:hypothetical protein
LDDLGAVVAAEEEACFGVLDGFGLALLEGSLGASVARFSRRKFCVRLDSWPKKSTAGDIGDLHLAKHGGIGKGIC